MRELQIHTRVSESVRVCGKCKMVISTGLFAASRGARFDLTRFNVKLYNDEITVISFILEYIFFFSRI